MKTLSPLVVREEYFKPIEDEINKLFFELIYKPLLLAIGSDKELSNSSNPLIDALKSGRVWVQDGLFYGSFNMAISKELKKIGAVKKKRSWKYEGALPPEISTALAVQSDRYNKAVQAALTTLDNINVERINEISTIPDQYVDTIDKMETAFQRSLKAISIAPKLTDDQRGIIAAEWGQNLDLYVRSWTSENILKMRQDIQRNTFAGKRSTDLEKYIAENYNVSRRKAKFLARQETSLLMSKFRETRYKDIGSQGYIWRGSMDKRERKDHEALEGKYFTWDNPPVVDRKTGRRAHPGEDFNCRCVAVAVIK